MIECDLCGGAHKNVPVTDLRGSAGDLYADCPHCGESHTFEAETRDEIDRHPAVPKDEPVTCLCQECNGGYKVRV